MTEAITESNLDDPGREPRYPLWLKPTIGSEFRVKMVQTEQRLRSFNGEEPTLLTTGSTLPSIYQVEPPKDPSNPEGYILKVVYGAPQINKEITPEEMIPTLQVQLATLIGVEMRSEFTPYGKLISFDVTGGIESPMTTELHEALRSGSLSSTEANRPEQPVGVGAQWSSESEASLFGMPAKILNTNRVLSMDEIGAEVEGITQTTFIPGPIEGAANNTELQEGSISTSRGKTLWRYDLPAGLTNFKISTVTRVRTDETQLEDTVEQTQQLQLTD